jgi:hypothetical protein
MQRCCLPTLLPWTPSAPMQPGSTRGLRVSCIAFAQRPRALRMRSCAGYASCWFLTAFIPLPAYAPNNMVADVTGQPRRGQQKAGFPGKLSAAWTSERSKKRPGGATSESRKRSGPARAIAEAAAATARTVPTALPGTTLRDSDPAVSATVLRVAREWQNQRARLPRH